MSQGFKYDSWSVTIASWGKDMRELVMVGNKLHHGSHTLGPKGVSLISSEPLACWCHSEFIGGH